MNKLVSRNSVLKFKDGKRIEKHNGGGGLLLNLFDLFNGRYEENLLKLTLQRINQTMKEAKEAGLKAAKDFDRGYSLASRKGFYLAPHPNSGNDTNFLNGILTYNNFYRFEGKNKSKNTKQNNIFLKKYKNRLSEIKDVKAVLLKLLDLGLLKSKYGVDGKWGKDTEKAYLKYLNIKFSPLNDIISNQETQDNNEILRESFLANKGIYYSKKGGSLVSKNTILRFKEGRKIIKALLGIQAKRNNLSNRNTAKGLFKGIFSGKITPSIQNIGRMISSAYKGYLDPEKENPYLLTGVAPTPSITKGISAVKSVKDLGKTANSITSSSDDVIMVGVSARDVPTGARILAGKNGKKYFDESTGKWINIIDDFDDDVKIVGQASRMTKPVSKVNKPISNIQTTNEPTTNVSTMDYDYNNDVIIANSAWDDAMNYDPGIFYDIFKKGGVFSLKNSIQRFKKGKKIIYAKDGYWMGRFGDWIYGDKTGNTYTIKNQITPEKIVPQKDGRTIAKINGLWYNLNGLKIVKFKTAPSNNLTTKKTISTKPTITDRVLPKYSGIDLLGKTVGEWQNILKDYYAEGTPDKYKTDGIWGDATNAAYKAYLKSQSSNGPKYTPGIEKNNKFTPTRPTVSEFDRSMLPKLSEQPKQPEQITFSPGIFNTNFTYNRGNIRSNRGVNYSNVDEYWDYLNKNRDSNDFKLFQNIMKTTDGNLNREAFDLIMTLYGIKGNLGRRDSGRLANLLNDLNLIGIEGSDARNAFIDSYNKNFDLARTGSNGTLYSTPRLKELFEKTVINNPTYDQINFGNLGKLFLQSQSPFTYAQFGIKRPGYMSYSDYLLNVIFKNMKFN